MAITDATHPMGNGNLPAAHGEQLAEISTGIVQLYSRHYGKGPTKAKTHLAGDDVVVCTLRGGFTSAERTLIDRGDGEAVYSLRHAFQKAMGSAFTSVVERVLDRHVIACVSQVHIDPDMSVETFMLEPRVKPTLTGGDSLL